METYRSTLMEQLARPTTEFYDQVAQCLVGLIPEEEVLKKATDKGTRCEVAYYLGVRAQAAGRWEEASDWYRVAVETGKTDFLELKWAARMLVEIHNSEHSIARLEREGLPPAKMPTEPSRDQ